MILVIARLRIRPDGVEAFRRAFEDVRTASLREEGAVSYSAHTGLTDPGEIVFIEEWADRATLDRHFAEAHFAAFDRTLQTLLISKPEVYVHEIERSERL